MRGANLLKAEFTRSDLKDADLTGANLEKVELGRSNLSGAKLSGVSMRYANLSRVIFGGNSLAGVDLTGAYTLLTRFEDVDLSTSLGLQQFQIDIACGNDKTHLPDGLNRPRRLALPCGGIASLPGPQKRML